jgi:hypothetical protein
MCTIADCPEPIERGSVEGGGVAVGGTSSDARCEI